MQAESLLPHCAGTVDGADVVRTTSELAFESYCASRGYAVQRIRTGGVPTPDFEARVNNSRVIFEIKELTPNRHDIEQAHEFRTRGTTGGSLDGSRVRGVIHSAARQLKCFRDERIPTVLVLYDNIVVDGIRPYRARCPYFDPTQIEWAMYGRHVAEFQLPLRGDPIWLGDRRGGKRQLTGESRTYISAVAVLAERGEYAWFFHNYFATVPLSRALLNDERDRHFHNPSHPLKHLAGWVELICRS